MTHQVTGNWVARREGKGKRPKDILQEIGRPRWTPTDLSKVSALLGIVVQEDSQLGFDGYCTFSVQSGEARIVTESLKSPRGRFYWAHAIGHIMLHEDGRTYRDVIDFTTTSAVEREANDYAGGLLMPFSEVDAAFKMSVMGKRTNCVLQDISASLSVTRAAARERLGGVVHGWAKY